MDWALAVVSAIVAWWFSTGAVLYLIGLPRQTVGLSMLAASVAAGAAGLGLWLTADLETPAAAFGAFTCGLLVWAWHEMSFLTGVITGPRRTRLPARSQGWRRFVYATEAVIYHEVAILLTAIVLIALLWDAPNRVGLMTFLILWLAKLSAKLNVFLGARNLTVEFLPDHLAYLASYFRRRPMNLLFPVSITLTTGLAGLLIAGAAAASTPFEATGATLLATLAALAVCEHWFLVLPIPAARLFAWGLASREPQHKHSDQTPAPSSARYEPHPRLGGLFEQETDLKRRGEGHAL